MKSFHFKLNFSVILYPTTLVLSSNSFGPLITALADIVCAASERFGRPKGSFRGKVSAVDLADETFGRFDVPTAENHYY